MVKFNYGIAILAFAMFLAAGCGAREAIAQPRSEPSTQPVKKATPRLAGVETFLYQLQNLDTQAVGASSYDLVIMDYSSDGSNAKAYKSSAISKLKQRNEKPDRVILSYLSIGEAESYRYYWQAKWDSDKDGQPEKNAPVWLDAENPDWDGNYKVKYWDPKWQALVFGSEEAYLDKIIDAGFDGVYLDIIDGYWHYQEQGRKTAARDMADFVIALTKYARSKNPEFVVVPQNAVALVTMFDDYLAMIDGVGQENVFYGEPEDGERSPANFMKWIYPHLDKVVAQKKAVLATAYTQNKKQIDENEKLCHSRGYVPFSANRELNSNPRMSSR